MMMSMSVARGMEVLYRLEEERCRAGGCTQFKGHRHGIVEFVFVFFGFCCVCFAEILGEMRAEKR